MKLTTVPQPGERLCETHLLSGDMPRDVPAYVVRLVTTGWKSKAGVFRVAKELRPLNRQSSGNLLQEEASALGVLDALGRITNLYQVEDGVYTLQVTNQHYDRESGILDDWDLELVPYAGVSGPCLESDGRA